MAELTDQQELFCLEYIKDLNQTNAAIRAGYSEDTAAQQGSRLLRNVKVKAKIEELKEARAKELGIDNLWVLQRFIEISDRCMQAEPVMKYDPDKKAMMPTGEFVFDSGGAIKATENIGKHIGFFEKDNEQGKPVVNIYDARSALLQKLGKEQE